jgi:hypothetical protein
LLGKSNGVCASFAAPRERSVLRFTLTKRLLQSGVTFSTIEACLNLYGICGHVS